MDSNALYINTYPQTSGIFVSGNDVYVAGYISGETFPQALYWQNGVVHKVGPPNSAALCISVSGNDVYVGGYISKGADSYGVIWKNGVEIPLGNANEECTVSSILVSGGDIYFVGTDFVGR